MQVDQMTLAHARLAMREAIRDWLFDPNVTLIDFGWPEHKGQLAEDELAIRIHVRKKYPSGPQLEAAVERGITSAEIPETIAGFATDVPEGPYQLHQWTWWGGWGWRTANPRARRADPMQGGLSISNAYHSTYATLGGLVMDRSTRAPMILSNWHVLAGDWGARPGRPIYQPGRRDGATSADTVATLSRDAMLSHNLDAAVATLTGSRGLVNKQFGLGPVKGVRRFELGMEVVKSGRRTDITFGRVTNVIMGTAHLWYSGLYFTIHNVVTIDARHSYEEVSAGGDSGSWWLERATMQAIGLHFAGYNRPERALAVDMQSVLDALDVDIATEV